MTRSSHRLSHALLSVTALGLTGCAAAGTAVPADLSPPVARPSAAPMTTIKAELVCPQGDMRTDSIADYAEGYNGFASPELAFDDFAAGYLEPLVDDVEVIQVSPTDVVFAVTHDGLPQLIAHARTIGDGWVVDRHEACATFDAAARTGS